LGNCAGSPFSRLSAKPRKAKIDHGRQRKARNDERDGRVKKPTRRTAAEERAWRTTVRLAVVATALSVLLAVALVARFF